MIYTNFSLEKVRNDFALTLSVAPLFPKVMPAPISQWLEETLQFTKDLALRSGSEKARSQFIIAPILASFTQQQRRFTIFSGQYFDVSPELGLSGECDFLLSLNANSPIVEAPVFALVEAKKQDIEGGLGQCAAQMVAAWRFNQDHTLELPAVYGCVTSGETWQFLRLEGSHLIVDQNRYYLDRLGILLGVINQILEQFL